MSEKIVQAEVLSDDVAEKVRKAFNFSVDKYELQGPDGKGSGLWGLYRSDTKDLVSSKSVKSGYTPHNVDDVLALVEATSVAFDGTADVKCYFRNGHFVTVTPSRDYRRSVVGTDIIHPRVLISAGYDGLPFRAECGFFRDVCSNLAVMRTIDGISVSIRHTAQLRPRLEDLVTQFRALPEGWKAFGETVAKLQEQRVNLRQFLLSIYPEPPRKVLDDGMTIVSGRALTEHQSKLANIFTRVAVEHRALGQPELTVDSEVSAWEAYNAVQGYVQHGRRRNKGATQDDRLFLSLQDSDVARAESLALATIA